MGDASDNLQAMGKRVMVVGAGPAGLAAAAALARGGARVIVVEASGAVGGMARTMEVWGQRVDIGPHRFFTKNLRVQTFWREAAGEDRVWIERLTRMYYKKRFFHYPLRAAEALAKLGLWEAFACVLSYVAVRLGMQRCGDDSSFEGWVCRRFGRRLYSLFFKSYSEKLWGIPCSELDAEFAAQRIKKLSLGEAMKAALGVGRETHRTLADRFEYPRMGAGAVYERLAEEIRARGGDFRMETRVCAIRTGSGDAIHGVTAAGEDVACDAIVSTMPLTALVSTLEGVPEAVRTQAGRLRFRNTILAYLLVDAVDLFPDQWIYVHSPELQIGRVTNFENWVPRRHGRTILAAELWCNDDDALWNANDAEVARLAVRDVEATGLLQGRPVVDSRIVRVPKCYPVYAKGYRGALEPVIAFLRSVPRLHVIGRYGAFKYNNQDHSILMGLLAADNILNGAGHDLWAVNSDTEEYQES